MADVLKCELFTLLYSTLTLTHTISNFNNSKIGSYFENIVEKGEKAGGQYFLLFLQRFLPILT